MTSQQKQEFTRRISQANKTDMVVILYEICIQYLKDLQDCITSADYKQTAVLINKIRGCINELIGSLNFDSELAANLLQLYIFCSKELVQVQLQHNVEALACVMDIMRALHDAYAQIADQDQSEAVMGNAQSVYAGLTYGKSSLNENVVGLSGNRGFLA